MSMKTFALMGGLAGAMLAAGAAQATDTVSSDPVTLNNAELDNVTAGVDRIRARIRFDTFQIDNADTTGPDDGFGGMTTADDDTVFSGGGQTTFALLARSTGGYVANIVSGAGNGTVRLQELRTISRIEY